RPPPPPPPPAPPRLLEGVAAPSRVTCSAAGRFCPCTASNSALSPSSSDLKPPPWMAEWWTKRSFPPSSGVMKPKPLSLLNHFTVPLARIVPPFQHVGAAPESDDSGGRFRRRAARPQELLHEGQHGRTYDVVLQRTQSYAKAIALDEHLAGMGVQ